MADASTGQLEARIAQLETQIRRFGIAQPPMGNFRTGSRTTEACTTGCIARPLEELPATGVEG